MRKTTLGVAAISSALMALALAPTASADTVAVSATVNAGQMTMTVSAPSGALSDTIGGNAGTPVSAASAWTVKDYTGAGAGWTMSVSATDLAEDGGTGTIPVSALSIAAGTVTKQDGTVTGNTVTLSTSDQALASAASGNGAGDNSFTPSFTLNLPGTTKATAGAYSTTITVTLS